MGLVVCKQGKFQVTKEDTFPSATYSADKTTGLSLSEFKQSLTLSLCNIYRYHWEYFPNSPKKQKQKAESNKTITVSGVTLTGPS